MMASLIGSVILGKLGADEEEGAAYLREVADARTQDGWGCHLPEVPYKCYIGMNPFYTQKRRILRFGSE